MFERTWVEERVRPGRCRPRSDSLRKVEKVFLRLFIALSRYGIRRKCLSLQLHEVFLSQSGEVLSELGRGPGSAKAVSALPFLQR